MRVLCGYSGIEFTCDHFPGYFTSRETIHPVFHIPQKKLLSYIGKWSASELTKTDSYLLFLALLNSTDLVTFRTPAMIGPLTMQVVASEMEALAITVSHINSISSPSVKFPPVVISSETKDLANAHWWIENWKAEYKLFRNGYKSVGQSQRAARRETALEKLIKNPFRSQKTLATSLADWAVDAADFPSNKTTVDGSQIYLSDYWRSIVYRLAMDQDIYSIDPKDISELLEHCEEHISLGSIYSHELFKVIRAGLERHNAFRGLGDYDAANLRKFTPFEILPDDATAQEATIQSMIDLAPAEEPRRDQYPTSTAFIRARARWNMKKLHGIQEST